MGGEGKGNGVPFGCAPLVSGKRSAQLAVEDDREDGAHEAGREDAAEDDREDGSDIEVKGNYSWGFINTIGSKMTLKNLDLEIK